MVNVSKKGELAWWLDAHRRYFAWQAPREWFELDDDILTVFDRFEVVEIEAPVGNALGIEVDVHEHEAVEAIVARVAQEWGRIDVLVAMQAAIGVGPWTPRTSTLDPALLQLVVSMNLFWTVYSCNAVTPIMKRERSGKIILRVGSPNTPSPDDGETRTFVAQSEERKDLSIP
jgi:3-oxoacyl-[acyl-carrier protein] reductase